MAMLHHAAAGNKCTNSRGGIGNAVLLLHPIRVDACQSSTTTLACSSYLASQAEYLRSFDFTANASHPLPAEWQQGFGRSPQCSSYSSASEAASGSNHLPLSLCPNEQSTPQGGTFQGLPLEIPPVYPPGHDKSHEITGIECCGDCYFHVPRVQVYYFPVPTGQAYCKSVGRQYGSVSDLSTWRALPDFTSLDDTDASAYQGSTVVNGHTLVAPSVYMQVEGSMIVNDKCGSVGTTLTSPLFSFAAEDISTFVLPPVTSPRPDGSDPVPLLTGQSQLNVADLACPSTGVAQVSVPDLGLGAGPHTYYYGSPWLPFIAPPSKILSSDPSWSTGCAHVVKFGPAEYVGLFDPPIALVPQQNIVNPVTAAAAAGATGSPTHPGQSIVAAVPKITAVAAAHVQEPPAENTGIVNPGKNDPGSKDTSSGNNDPKSTSSDRSGNAGNGNGDTGSKDTKNDGEGHQPAGGDTNNAKADKVPNKSSSVAGNGSGDSNGAGSKNPGSQDSGSKSTGSERNGNAGKDGNTDDSGTGSGSTGSQETANGSGSDKAASGNPGSGGSVRSSTHAAHTGAAKKGSDNNSSGSKNVGGQSSASSPNTGKDGSSSGSGGGNTENKDAARLGTAGAQTSNTDAGGDDKSTDINSVQGNNVPASGANDQGAKAGGVNNSNDVVQSKDHSASQSISQSSGTTGTNENSTDSLGMDSSGMNTSSDNVPNASTEGKNKQNTKASAFADQFFSPYESGGKSQLAGTSKNQPTKENTHGSKQLDYNPSSLGGKAAGSSNDVSSGQEGDRESPAFNSSETASPINSDSKGSDGSGSVQANNTGSSAGPNGTILSGNGPPNSTDTGSAQPSGSAGPGNASTSTVAFMGVGDRVVTSQTLSWTLIFLSIIHILQFTP
ncbi:uncharacterized protein KY384_003990 [Bacidia gigantensis]|uniref:uncharacterized protein n=1 Tax=Bacidia gigantensis TaxID=2732470 RepID=UPI001D039CE1|nr:uncharacterized protein KY384_003990 [Bacidia gigantensis]KAG8531279.1 hypothetical protein KY384_003990 [Bacidia gigantensis]